MARLLKNTQIKTGSFAVQLPMGTSSLGPTSPVHGQIRFNQTNNKIEFYYNGTWNQVAKIGRVTLTADEFTGDGIQTVFTMSTTESNDADIAVYIGGVYQQPGINYGVTGAQLIFTSPPPAPGINPNKIVVVHGINSTDAV